MVLLSVKTRNAEITDIFFLNQIWFPFFGKIKKTDKLIKKKKKNHPFGLDVDAVSDRTRGPVLFRDRSLVNGKMRDRAVLGVPFFQMNQEPGRHLVDSLKRDRG